MNRSSLKENVDALIAIMQSQKYGDGTILNYRRVFRKFIDYCNALDIETIDEITAIEYVNKTTGNKLTDLASVEKNTKIYKVLLRAMRMLEEYYRTGAFISRFSRFQKNIEPHPFWNNIYIDFIHYLQTNCDYAESTISHKEITIRQMLNILIQRNINSLQEIDSNIIEMLLSHFIHESSKSVMHRIGEIKQFFQYCFDYGLSQNNLVYLIPEITIRHTSKIRVSWTNEDVKKLLNSIDRSSPVGKRDYAILLLACVLGLRAIDIVRLELSDFDWERKVIIVRQKKTGKTIVLPLLNDIGWAVIDYIKNGRPNTEDQRLFIRLNAPFEGFSKGGALGRIFSIRAHEAGLRINRDCRYGIHSLRHTLGSLLLEKGTPLQVISQIMGHSSVQSTETYLRINMSGLSMCPIDPEKVFNDEV